VNMGPSINTSTTDANVWISPDGLELYFMSTRPEGYGSFDLWVTRRATENDAWGEPANLGPVVNSAYNEDGVGLSPDGLLLLFDDNAKPRPGGYGNSDFWMTRRVSLSDPWQTPVNLGPKINGPGLEFPPRLSPDGRTLYFGSNRSSPWDSWQAPILPIVDFNGDEIVDIQDLLRLIESWGKDDPSVDIGPMPWGDSKVDAADLEVLMGYWQQEVSPLIPFSLIAYWRLDEADGTIAIDSAGTSDGVLVGNPSWQPTGGKVKGALQFDGIDDYVKAPFVLNLPVGAFSVFAWVQGSAPGEVILSQMGKANWLSTEPTSGWLVSDLKSADHNGRTLWSQTVITDGNWHRIGLVCDGSKPMLSLYVDGVEVAQTTEAISVPSSTGSLFIGVGSNLKAVTRWSGLIDDIRIYDRAITP
jgi:hypothetical protein